MKSLNWKKGLFAVLVAAVVCPMAAADWYVSPAGKKKAAGNAPSAPLKDVYTAISKAKAGDRILLAAGKYTGQMGASEIIIDKPISLIGGYSPDFSQRDLVKYPSMIQPANDKNDTKGLSVITLKLPNGKGPDMVIDGIVIDQSYMNSYHTVKGKPAGVETGMWLEPPAKGANDKFGSAKSYSIYNPTASRYEGNIIIKNCIISNSGNFGINISMFSGKVQILNNIFVACRMEACEVSCSNAKSGAVECEFANNTVLFTWSRTAEFTDMGYGFRCLAKVTSNIHHNIFGLNIFSGVGNDKGDAKSKKIKLDNNVFFLNKQSDVTAVKSPNILKLNVGTDAFEDMEDFPGMESVEGNIALKDPAAFKGVINDAYLTAFLNASYSEKTDYNENSPANLFRAAMGMNKVGTIQTKVSMYGNRYPLQDTFKLFGAYKGYGAQPVK
ncbi:MAG: right-handed parallel beta-helix repeat-containing protein [Lentisphaeria bacterium]|nr:right-handed parallel beta-helix repeat-containing protein [Lentisphaeria bacterium]